MVFTLNLRKFSVSLILLMTIVLGFFSSPFIATVLAGPYTTTYTTTTTQDNTIPSWTTVLFIDKAENTINLVRLTAKLVADGITYSQQAGNIPFYDGSTLIWKQYDSVVGFTRPLGGSYGGYYQTVRVSTESVVVCFSLNFASPESSYLFTKGGCASNKILALPMTGSLTYIRGTGSGLPTPQYPLQSTLDYVYANSDTVSSGIKTFASTYLTQPGYLILTALNDYGTEYYGTSSWCHWNFTGLSYTLKKAWLYGRGAPETEDFWSYCHIYYMQCPQGSWICWPVNRDATSMLASDTSPYIMTQDTDSIGTAGGGALAMLIETSGTLSPPTYSFQGASLCWVDEWYYAACKPLNQPTTTSTVTTTIPDTPNPVTPSWATTFFIDKAAIPINLVSLKSKLTTDGITYSELSGTLPFFDSSNAARWKYYDSVVSFTRPLGGSYGASYKQAVCVSTELVVVCFSFDFSATDNSYVLYKGGYASEKILAVTPNFGAYTRRTRLYDGGNLPRPPPSPLFPLQSTLDYVYANSGSISSGIVTFASTYLTQPGYLILTALCNYGGGYYSYSSWCHWNFAGLSYTLKKAWLYGVPVGGNMVECPEGNWFSTTVNQDATTLLASDTSPRILTRDPDSIGTAGGGALAMLIETSGTLSPPTYSFQDQGSYALDWVDEWYYAACKPITQTTQIWMPAVVVVTSSTTVTQTTTTSIVMMITTTTTIVITSTVTIGPAPPMQSSFGGAMWKEMNCTYTHI